MSDEYGNDFITLIDEDGVEAEYEHIDTLEYNNEVYFALVRTDLDEQDFLDADGSLIILKLMIDENGDEMLTTIESDSEYDEVAEVFERDLSDYYEIEH